MVALGALGLAIAGCGGGGDGDIESLLTPGSDGDTRPTATSPAVFGGGGVATPGANTPGAGRTPTPVDPNATPTPVPAGPEGAVNLETVGHRPSGNSEVGDGGSDEPGAPPIGPWVTPLLAWDAIGSKFGEDRGDPYVHGGIDFRTDSTPGVDVYAVCDGFVAGIDYSDTHGRYIVLKCPEKWTVVYGFMEIVDVEIDDTVVKGETVLGTVASFLHFEMRWDFKPVDPEQQLQFHVRPKGVLLAPTATPTPLGEDDDEPEDTPTPSPVATNTPASGGGGGNPEPTSTPTPEGPPTATPTPSNTPTPEPTPTPTPKPPTPTPTPLPQAF
jgi:murein DD-endopeptidase MepM/ murein hydrolase activator NlpD